MEKAKKDQQTIASVDKKDQEQAQHDEKPEKHIEGVQPDKPP